ncbi:MAG: carbamoyltransferase HypF [Euryarchaeota archaeon]|nr:carbamoyltransferase HypF [Euryarchaeota archaeon]
MRRKGQIIIKGIVQGVGFRPFVYSRAKRFNIRGTVMNLGSEVRITASGEHFSEFLDAVSEGTPLSIIDSVTVNDIDSDDCPADFTILNSTEGSHSGFIPTDVATCDECLRDIYRKGGRYEGYWATSCVNCGPRYSIIRAVPYDRERTTMDDFPICSACAEEYGDPSLRRHHAQTIACAACGPALQLLNSEGEIWTCRDPIQETAGLLDSGEIICIRGIGGFHIACIEESAETLKQRLCRTEQPLAIMATLDIIEEITHLSKKDREILQSPAHPIVVLHKRDPLAHPKVSNLHTLGCMLPYTGLHHMLLSHLQHKFLIMTSANVPGYPMITDIDHAMSHLNRDVDYFLTHNRTILNRCDDSVLRDGHIIRLSRGLAPKRMQIDLGERCILGVGPELNSNISVYKNGFCITSPHVGNVRNPPTLEYLKETVEKTGTLTGAEYEIIAHDLHPQFLSTRYAHRLAEECGAEIVAVQHHRAHIAAATSEPCIGIAIDGVGYGDDGTVWGGEIFAGQIPHLKRVAHLETVQMPGGDLATKFPERMLYGMLPDNQISELLASRGWSDSELGILEKQVKIGFNIAKTSSTGRVLDAASALLGICRERTYDGEPAMKLESAAQRGRPEKWEISVAKDSRGEVLSTTTLMRDAFSRMERESVSDIAASFQYNLARGIAKMAVSAAYDHNMEKIALSGGVAINQAIRHTIIHEIKKAGLIPVVNREYPFGDGCISYGQCVYAGSIIRDEK